MIVDYWFGIYIRICSILVFVAYWFLFLSLELYLFYDPRFQGASSIPSIHALHFLVKTIYQQVHLCVNGMGPVSLL